MKRLSAKEKISRMDEVYVKVAILCLLALLLISLYGSYANAYEQTIDTPMCINETMFRIDKRDIEFGEINIQGCTYIKKSNNSLWYDCGCAYNQTNKITFVTTTNETSYAIYYEYFVDNTSDSRKDYYNLVPPPKPLPPSATMSINEAIQLVGIVIIVLFVIGFVIMTSIALIYYLFRKYSQDEAPKKHVPRKFIVNNSDEFIAAKKIMKDGDEVIWNED